MKHAICFISIILGFICQPALSQIHFKTLTHAYNDDTGEKIGVQFISADITQGQGTMTIEDTEMKAVITNTVSDSSYGITGYALNLSTSNGKKVWATVSKYNDGRFTVLIHFAEGDVRYDIDRPPLTLNDYAKTQSHKVTYDESFTPTLHLTFKNLSDKVITSIEVVISYNEGLDPYEWRYPERSYVVRSRIRPGEYGTVVVTTPGAIDGRKPGSFYISRLRFEDGSICDR